MFTLLAAVSAPSIVFEILSQGTLPLAGRPRPHVQQEVSKCTSDLRFLH